MTLFTRLQAQFDVLEKDIQALEGAVSSNEMSLSQWAVWEKEVQRISGTFKEMTPNVDKLVVKAKETDPNKVIYNSAVSTKIISFSEVYHEALSKFTTFALSFETMHRAVTDASKKSNVATDTPKAADPVPLLASPSPPTTTTTTTTTSSNPTTTLNASKPSAPVSLEPSSPPTPSQPSTTINTTNAPSPAPTTSASPPTLDSSSFVLNIETVGGGSAKLTLSLPKGSSTLVEDVKTLVHERLSSYPPERQLLIATGKRLQDGKTLGDYQIVSGGKIHVGKAAVPTSPSHPAQPSLSTTNTNTTSPSPLPATLPPSSPSSQSSSLSKDEMIAQISSSLRRIKAAVAHDVFIKAVQTLGTIIGNVLQHPTEEKYRKIKTENSVLRDRLFAHDGGLDSVRSIGFSETEPGILTMSSPSPHLSAVHSLLNDALKMHGATPSPGPAPSTPSTPSNPWAALRNPAPSAPRPSFTQPPSSTPSPNPSSPFSFPPFGAPPPMGFPPSGDMPQLPFGNMSQMMNNPMVQQLISNPEMMQQMMSDPMVQQMLQNPQMIAQMQSMMGGMFGGNGPDLSQIMGNPAMMQSMNQMMSNPQMQQQMQQMMGSMFGGMPQGSNPPQNPFGNAFPNLFGFPPPSNLSTTPSATPTSTPASTNAPPRTSSAPTPAQPPVDDEDAMLQEAIRLSLQMAEEEEGKKKKENPDEVD